MAKKEYQALTVPTLEWNKQTLSSMHAELVVQPLAPGFGVTFGNTLRRILLGGIEGSAVTSVIISGVNNEFSTLPGVEEDVMQIILNCKNIKIKNKLGKPGTMKLSVIGAEAAVTVADIVPDEHLELVNKDFVLAHVATGGKLDIIFYVEPGRGYQVAQWPVGKALQEDGRIYIDAMFSPVMQVTYDVEKTRVGDDIDFDKLIFTIDTDGTETPVDVFHYAVSVVRNQLEHFLVTVEIPFNDFSQSTESVESEQVSSLVKSDDKVRDLLLSPIDALELSVRAHNCLINAGIKRVIDLVNMQKDDVIRIKNFGKKSFEEVENRVIALGLLFGMNINEKELEAV
jgi:DNA-directed RNA polymerase subunit alpha